MAEFSERGRQVVHILVGGFALLLRWLVWWQAALLAMVAVTFNLFALPALNRRVFRPGDLDSPFRSGIVIYPLAVLALVLSFPHRLDIVAAAWGILAAGDGMATLIGAHVRTRPLPWNRTKSTGGLVAFIVCGGAAGAGLALWTRAPHEGAVAWTMGGAFAAALVAGFVETVPIRLNDNISVPAMAALVLWSASVVRPEIAAGFWPLVQSRLPAAIVVNAAAAVLGWRIGGVTIAGAVTGGVIGAGVLATTGLPGWLLLFATFLAAAITTRAGFQRKALLGIEEARHGRRGAGNAIANTGPAAWAALLSIGVVHGEAARIAFVAALVTSASDTVASEVGKAWGKTTWLLRGFRRVPPGTSGAVSAEGTLAGILAATMLGGLAALLGLIPIGAIAMIMAAATLASFAEGALATTLEGPGILNNDALNFINSAIGAALALVAWTLI